MCAKANAANYTTTQFAYAQSDADQFDRTDVSTLAQAVDGHDHSSGKGIQIPTGGIADDAVTAAKIADGAIDAAAKLGSDVVTTAKILDANVTAAKLASDAVTTTKILDANVTAAKLASDAVTTAKIADSAVTAAKLSAVTVVGITNRQGGDATDWGDSGTTNYVPASAVMQCGSISATVGDGDLSVSVTVTYPAAFGGTPVVLTGVSYLGSPNSAIEMPKVMTRIAAGTKTTAVTFWITRANPASTSGTQIVYVDWLAIGPPA